jgi:hypothetical protein
MDELRQTGWLLRGVAELVRSFKAAGAEQAGLFTDACLFRLYAGNRELPLLISLETLDSRGIAAFARFNSLLSLSTYRPDVRENQKRLQ